MLSGEGLLVELALAGRLREEELHRWLTAAGIGEQVAVLVFEVNDAQAGVRALERCLAEADVSALTGAYEGLLCAIVDDCDPLALASLSRAGLRKGFGEVHAAASRRIASRLASQGFKEARSALDAARASNGNAPEVASYEDLGALKLLLGLLSRQALAAYCEVVLGPLLEGEERSYGEELLRSLDAFIEHNGHWERAAQALYCHRHTLRYRIRRVEELTKRDFSRARDRIELWLALRGRELVR
jgi:purine catabolism regulator